LQAGHVFEHFFRGLRILLLDLRPGDTHRGGSKMRIPLDFTSHHHFPENGFVMRGGLIRLFLLPFCRVRAGIAARSGNLRQLPPCIFPVLIRLFSRRTLALSSVTGGRAQQTEQRQRKLLHDLSLPFDL